MPRRAGMSAGGLAGGQPFRYHDKHGKWTSTDTSNKQNSNDTFIDV